jgi:hypothetical protein
MLLFFTFTICQHLFLKCGANVRTFFTRTIVFQKYFIIMSELRPSFAFQDLLFVTKRKLEVGLPALFLFTKRSALNFHLTFGL